MNELAPKHVLLVDDDVVVAKIYRDRIAQLGLRATVAQDGLAAVQFLKSERPDAVVLDLMMPRFTGVDVLKFMRGNPHLANVPVVLLSSSFANELATQANSIGVQAAVLKVRCTPKMLTGILMDLMVAAPSKQNLASVTPKAPVDVGQSAHPFTPPAPAHKPDAPSIEARKLLLATAAQARGDVHALAHAFLQAKNGSEGEMRLQNFYRCIDFLATTAGMGEVHHLALLSSALAALLFELMSRPALATPSVRRTIAFTADFLGSVLEQLPTAKLTAPLKPEALVVDDDPISNKLTAAALRRAHLVARSTESPLEAIQLARKQRFDLFLLDIAMPDLDGFQVCEQLRQLPEYRTTPIIFVTARGDFENRTKSVLSGGNDLISKPILPIELAVKAVTHLLKSAPAAQVPAVK
ncbi:MAG: hypothetical protein RLY20_3089 [Verrucomicrobiota bacterium]|jgi:CheY-like chemotaxis protein